MGSPALSGLTLNKPVMLAGRLFFGRWVAGVSPTTLVGPIEIDKMIITPTADSVELKSKAIGKYGQTLSSINLPGAVNVEFSSLDGSPEVIAMQLLGAVTALTQSSSSWAAEAFTLVPDEWVDLGKRMLSNIVVKDVTDTTTYVEGTDYDVDLITGFMRSLSTGTGLTNVHVTGDYAAISGSKVDINTVSQLDLKMVLEGENLDDDEPIILTLSQARIRPAAGQDVMSSTHWVPQMTGVARTPTGDTTPGYLEYLNTAPA
jgi:hypothetical protein